MTIKIFIKKIKEECDYHGLSKIESDKIARYYQSLFDEYMRTNLKPDDFFKAHGNPKDFIKSLLNPSKID